MLEKTIDVKDYPFALVEISIHFKEMGDIYGNRKSSENSCIILLQIFKKPTYEIRKDLSLDESTSTAVVAWSTVITPCKTCKKGHHLESWKPQ